VPPDVAARIDNNVNFINKQNETGIISQFPDQLFETILKISAVAPACNKHADIK